MVFTASVAKHNWYYVLGAGTFAVGLYAIVVRVTDDGVL